MTKGRCRNDAATRDSADVDARKVRRARETTAKSTGKKITKRKHKKKKNLVNFESAHLCSQPFHNILEMLNEMHLINCPSTISPDMVTRCSKR